MDHYQSTGDLQLTCRKYHRRTGRRDVGRPRRWLQSLQLQDPRGLVCSMELKDGTVLDVDYPHCWGLPENPMLQSDVEEKFRSVTSPVMSEARQNALIEAMREVDSIKSVSRIYEPLVVRSRLDTPIAAE